MRAGKRVMVMATRVVGKEGGNGNGNKGNGDGDGNEGISG